MLKRVVVFLLGYVFVGVIVLPLCVTVLCGGFVKDAEFEPIQETRNQENLVRLEDLATTELEEYIIGVVSAEMPVSFDMEALKAQAVAARTYQVRKMLENASTGVLYDVGQAYMTPEELKNRWQDNYTAYTDKIRSAVKATEGEIMVYEGEPILAVFHAQSAGKTENAENVWQNTLPYLKSVDIPQDNLAPNNEVQLELTQEEVWRRLQSLCAITANADELTLIVAERSSAGYVQKVSVTGGGTLRGREVREALGLRSANFTVEKKDGVFHFVTKGYGHGAGMSQHGANFLAQDGKGYHEILKYFYQGISFERFS